ncbi:alpha/beta hydrolase [Stenoxybacter acetivorans]|uniref:alpha/beta hydrolase n=1 Tax=Stenoxybacter acetivorans TaxID=422441 RepID=UPI00056AEA87|nr:alpha/beta hydrolase [Stenoxybacter acetivorans]
MNAAELEDLALWLIRDADETSEMWLDRWQVSYPSSFLSQASAMQTAAQWQRLLQGDADRINAQNIMVVAHGIGALAWLAWWYQSDILTQKRVRAVMLVSPPQAICQQEAFEVCSRVRLINLPAALVVGQDDVLCPKSWAQTQAQSWQMRLCEAPQSGHLNESLHGWQWGMKLMQKMLLA